MFNFLAYLSRSYSPKPLSQFQPNFMWSIPTSRKKNIVKKKFGHITKLAAMPIYGQYLNKSSCQKGLVGFSIFFTRMILKGSPKNLVKKICFLSITIGPKAIKFVQVSDSGPMWPLYWYVGWVRKWSRSVKKHGRQLAGHFSIYVHVNTLEVTFFAKSLWNLVKTFASLIWELIRKWFRSVE